MPKRCVWTARVACWVSHACRSVVCSSLSVCSRRPRLQTVIYPRLFTSPICFGFWRLRLAARHNPPPSSLPHPQASSRGYRETPRPVCSKLTPTFRVHPPPPLHSRAVDSFDAQVVKIVRPVSLSLSLNPTTHSLQRARCFVVCSLVVVCGGGGVWRQSIRRVFTEHGGRD